MAIRVSAASKKVIAASIGAVAEKNVALTKAFYQRMFKNNPELLDVFNLTHQKSGDQPQALFGSIVFGAKSALSDGETGIPMPVVLCICHKHCSLDIQPDQYDIVGKNLLETIQAELGVGKEVLDAWGELYGQVAGACIGVEKSLYEQSLKQGGWAGRAPLKIVGKKAVSETVTEFTLQRPEGGKLPTFSPGQYISVWPSAKQLKSDHSQPRQYSLVSNSGDDTIRIAVRLVDGGTVSTWLHNEAVEGTVVDCTSPFGPVQIPSDAKKILFVSSGVGITGNIGVARNVVWSAAPTSDVHWVYACNHGAQHPYRQELVDLQRQFPSFQRHVFYREPRPSDEIGVHYNHKGDIDLSALKLGDLGHAHALVSGGGAGVKPVVSQLLKLGVPRERIHVELFGSGLNLVTPE